MSGQIQNPKLHRKSVVDTQAALLRLVRSPDVADFKKQSLERIDLLLRQDSFFVPRRQGPTRSK